MSQLHKSLLKTKLGLDPVVEDGPTSLSEMAAEELESIKNPPRKTHTIDTTLKDYATFKETFFLDLEVFTNEDISFQTYYKKPPTATSPLLFCLHGAGSSSMTYAKLAEKVSPDAGVFLFDLRGHGGSSPTEDFSMKTFVKDLQFIFEEFITKYKIQSPIYFLGHSLGGSIIAQFLNQHKPKVQGLILLDIVEEIAIKSLSVMPQFISKRPQYFAHISEAIQWHMNFLLYDEELAKLSIPDLFNFGETLTWKLDLSKTEPFWDTWFEGLSKNFLNLSQLKLLVLSTHETLDKQLIIGQMQGKYQLIVFNNTRCGHFIHEDLPGQIGVSVLEFIKRNGVEDVKVVPTWGGKINT